jgi:Trypsin-like peptidase domain
MAPCERLDDSWQVVVCDDNGNIVGAGVLLDETRVLTCAHVILEVGGGSSGSDGRWPRVESVLCQPRWSMRARVLPDCWVSEHDTQRGDLALLELEEPVSCHRGATLRRAPVRGVEVRVRGFPDGDKIGTSAEGRLAGATKDGEWVEIHPQANNRAQWVTRGFSGAGVAEDASGDVVGIIIAVRAGNPTVVAYMMPVETIIDYLPRLRPQAVGGSTSDPIFSRDSDHVTDGSTGDGVSAGEAAADLALRQEIGRLFTGVWSGTAVVTGGDPDAGSPWLVRLVATADPVVRRRIPDAAIAEAPPGVVLGVGAIDLAIDAGGRPVEWIRRRIAERFQLPDGDCADLVGRLLRHQPRPTLVIDRVDGAQDPDGLVAELVAPIAAQARRRGLRLVLGFAGGPPATLRYEVSLGPEPVTGMAREPGVNEEVWRLIAELAAAEEELATWYARVSVRVADVPAPAPGIAARLRVRYAAATGESAPGGPPTGELTLIGGRARTARADTARRVDRLRELDRDHSDLGLTLKVYLERAERCFGAEDRQLSEIYGRARETLRARPCDLAVATTAVDAYVDAVRERERGT